MLSVRSCKLGSIPLAALAAFTVQASVASASYAADGASGGNPDDARKWPGSDFDSLCVLKISKGGSPAATLEIKTEQLNSVSDVCPK